MTEEQHARQAQSEAVRSFQDIPTRARGAIRKAPDTWARWLETCEAIESDQADMDAEDWALFFAQYSQLRRLGVPFSPAFVARVEELQELLDAGMCAETFLEDTDDTHDIGDAAEEREGPWHQPVKQMLFQTAEYLWKIMPRIARQRNHPARPLVDFLLQVTSQRFTQRTLKGGRQ